jgi:hypothetical protein
LLKINYVLIKLDYMTDLETNVMSDVKAKKGEAVRVKDCGDP